MSGKSAKSRRLRVRPETSEGVHLWAAIGAASPVPNRDNLDSTYTDVHCNADAAMRHGEPKMVDFEAVVPQRGARLAKEHADLPSVPYRVGDCTVQTPILSCPEDDDPVYESILDTSFARMLASGMLVLPAPAALTVTASAAVDDNSFQIDPPIASITTGTVLAADFNGRRSVGHVVEAAGDPQVVKLCSPLARAVEEDDLLRVGHVFGLDGPGELGPSVELEFNGRGWRDVAHGCRWNKLDIAIDGRRALASFTFDLPLIFKADSDADVVNGINDGGLPRDPYGSEVATVSGTRPTISDSPTWSRREPPAAPVLVGNVVLPVDEMTLSITNPLAARGDYDGIGMGPTEPDDPTFEGTLTLSRPLSEVERAMLFEAAENYHELVLPFGPTGRHGLAIIVPGASLMSDPDVYDASKGFYRTVLRFQAGPAAVQADIATAPQSPLKIALF